jgi:hypothetical protein
VRCRTCIGSISRNGRPESCSYALSIKARSSSDSAAR